MSALPAFARSLLRSSLRSANHVRRRLIRLLRLPDDGVHAVALARTGRIILVRLTYADGWYCPGGGRKRGETPEQGALRELREEIGLRSCGRPIHLGHFTDATDPPNRADAFLVQDVDYWPRWSLEITEVREFPLDALPPDLSGPSRTFLAAAWLHLPDAWSPKMPDNDGTR